jgi:ParB-like chromosome segregation protein Spo0J
VELKIEYLDKNSLKPYANNAKIHTPEQIEQIKKSIRDFGFNDPIAVWGENEIVEGHGRLLAAMEMDDIDTVPVIRLDELTDEQRRAYMLVHNKLTMNTGFDVDLLNLELSDITDIDMGMFGFGEDALEEKENPYTEEVKIPQYEVKGEPVGIDELCDDGKVDELLAEIADSDIPDDIKKFLAKAAQRHRVFDYRKIAEYYARADRNVQMLMEKSALVIIDYNDAIANGYVRLSEKIAGMSNEK